MMTAEEYQKATALTAKYPPEKALEYLILGMCSEAGEVAGKLKKFIRGDYSDGVVGWSEVQQSMDDEIGDVLWYISQYCNFTHTSLGLLMANNIEKLKGRAERGTLQGNGDTR